MECNVMGHTWVTEDDTVYICTIFYKGDNFVTSSLFYALLCNKIFWKAVCAKRKEFDPKGPASVA